MEGDSSLFEHCDCFEGAGLSWAAKALSQVFATELRGCNITVNVVAPGPVATELFLNGD
jgi:NADP-dependent 3-hydroxy acid dehydrogenase YdfG